MEKFRVSLPIVEERLTNAFKIMRTNKRAVGTKTLLDVSLPQDSFRKLYKEANLLPFLAKAGNTIIYNYPDPDSQDGKDNIKVMSLWLFEWMVKTKQEKYQRQKTRRNAGGKNTGKKREPYKRRAIQTVEAPPLLPQTTMEKVIKLLTAALLEAGAPLGKSVPGNFVREMQQKDIKINELTARVKQLEDILRPFDKMVDEAAKRRAKAN